MIRVCPSDGLFLCFGKNVIPGKSEIVEILNTSCVLESPDTPCPKLVDVFGLLKHIVGQRGNHFRFETWPATLLPVVLDPQLLHCVYRNAISNACKYGQLNGQVVTTLTLRPLTTKGDAHAAAADSDSRFAALELTLEVFNAPGPKHSMLLATSRQLVQDKVFAQGSRLHLDLMGTSTTGTVSSVSTDRTVSSVSSGDGGWIMRKCARALGGNCDIDFGLAGTTFVMHCPTKRPLDLSPTSTIREEVFELPRGCWGIAIDDSKMQRKVLAKLLAFAGVADDRISVVGGSADEIRGFAAMVALHVRKHTEDFHLVIVDENLDIQQDGSRLVVSGSQTIVELRRMLSAEGLEGKLLAIVRSASDSSAEVAVFRGRAHGFIAKLPLRRDTVLRTLAPIWLDRFPTPTSRM